jgi:hypothetical protein
MDSVESLRKLFVDIDDELQDGDFNYVMTKVLKNLKIDDLTICPRQIMQLKMFQQYFVSVAKYVYTPRYFNYNRAMGLFTSCRKEYE